MVSGRGKRRFTVRRTIAAERMPVEDWQMAERLLAKMVARAFAAEHPELFGAHLARALGGPANDERTTRS